MGALLGPGLGAAFGAAWADAAEEEVGAAVRVAWAGAEEEAAAAAGEGEEEGGLRMFAANALAACKPKMAVTGW